MKLDDLKFATLKAQKEIRPLIGSSNLIGKIGAGGDEIEEIDLLAERIIKNHLKKLGYSFYLISEEIGEVQIGSNPKFLIILDPIDGSTNATRGLPYFCISIAMSMTNTFEGLQMAVVLDIMSSNLFEAVRNFGAKLNGKPIEVSTTKKLEDSILAMNISPEIFVFNVKKYGDLYKKVKKIRVFGSAALDLCNVACGKLDIFVDLRKKLRIVDIAAGKLILEEAGGVVSNEMGEPLERLPLSIKTRTSVCASNKILKLELFKDLNIIA